MARTRKDWQVYFTVDGFVAPKDGILFGDDLFIRGTKERDGVSEVYFKISIEEDEPNIQETKNIRKKLRRLLQIYGLVSGLYAEMPSGMSYTTVEADQPLGKPKIRGAISSFLKVREEEWEEYTSLLKFSVLKYRELERIFADRNKRFFRNAIDYYYRALSDVTLEEALIDLFVSLESMLSTHVQELRLRLSLRTCLLLGRTEKEKREIFDLVYALYQERSNVVHEGEFKDVNWEDISKLSKYVRKVIISLIYVPLKKKKIIELIEKSIFVAENEKELIRLIKGSEEEWKRILQ